MVIRNIYFQLYFLFLMCAFSACSPRVVTIMEKTYEPLPSDSEIQVYPVGTEKPAHAEVLGNIKIDDNGASIRCGYDDIIAIAKEEVLYAGGNALWIFEHIRPKIMGSSCHQINAQILRIDTTQQMIEEDIVPKTDYTTLHIYRNSSFGSILSYNLYLNDSMLCRVNNPFRTTILIRKEGAFTLNASTSSKTEIPIKLKKGKTYYIRCSVERGLFSGVPKIQIMDAASGNAEFAAIDTSFHVDTITQADIASSNVKNLRLVLNGGYSYMLGHTKHIPPLLQDYAKDLKSAYHYGGDLIYYFRETIGLGIKFDRFNSRNKMDNIMLTDENGNVRTGVMSDNITNSFYALVLSTRYRNVFQSDQIYMNMAFGYIHYTNEFVLIDPFSMNGGNFGASCDFGYDLNLSKHLFIGAQASYVSGYLRNYNISDSQKTIFIELPNDQLVSMSRFNVSLGLRYIL